MTKTFPLFAVLFLALACVDVRGTWASDPPHDASNTIECSSCHVMHNPPGESLTTVNGNANLCLSCHNAAGPAAGKPFANIDQAIPETIGTSHRWDSAASGWMMRNPANTSTGTVDSGGAFTGPYAKIYTLTVTAAGNVGTALFSWTATAPGGGSGSNLSTGLNVALDQGITVTFADPTPPSVGPGIPTPTPLPGPSFSLNDTWSVYVRPDLNQPSTAAMANVLDHGKITCSTCHDEHAQTYPPFDPHAPTYSGWGSGSGRHFQRIADDLNQMCIDCHSVRNVTSSTQGSHPVGVIIPTGSGYKAP